MLLPSTKRNIKIEMIFNIDSITALDHVIAPAAFAGVASDRRE
jgi:hypothetical protein